MGEEVEDFLRCFRGFFLGLVLLLVSVAFFLALKEGETRDREKAEEWKKSKQVSNHIKNLTLNKPQTHNCARGLHKNLYGSFNTRR